MINCLIFWGSLHITLQPLILSICFLVMNTRSSTVRPPLMSSSCLLYMPLKSPALGSPNVLRGVLPLLLIFYHWVTYGSTQALLLTLSSRITLVELGWLFGLGNKCRSVSHKANTLINVLSLQPCIFLYFWTIISSQKNDFLCSLWIHSYLPRLSSCITP